MSSSTVDGYSGSGEAQSPHQRYQTVIVMRHGDRLDNSSPDWVATAPRPWDPPLDDNGKARAFSTGQKFRDHPGFSIHRVFVSPFLRCLETAAQAVTALCADPNDRSRNGVVLDPLQITVSIELGLCEMLNTLAIRDSVAPKDGKFTFDIEQCEAVLAGTIDKTAESIYKEVPKWQETLEGARARYVELIKKLADKYPSENLLLVTHGEGVGSSISGLMKGFTVCDVDYCGYSIFRRTMDLGDNKSFTAGAFIGSPKDFFGITLVEEASKNPA